MEGGVEGEAGGVEPKKKKKTFWKKVVEFLAYPIVHKGKEENHQRGNWANPVEFVLASLGFAIGLGKSH